MGSEHGGRGLQQGEVGSSARAITPFIFSRLLGVVPKISNHNPTHTSLFVVELISYTVLEYIIYDLGANRMAETLRSESCRRTHRRRASLFEVVMKMAGACFER